MLEQEEYQYLIKRERKKERTRKDESISEVDGTNDEGGEERQQEIP